MKMNNLKFCIFNLKTNKNRKKYAHKHTHAHASKKKVQCRGVFMQQSGNVNSGNQVWWISARM